MNRNEILNHIQRQYDAEKAKKPNWPVHVCGQAAMVAKEAGNLISLSAEEKYHPFKDEDYRQLQQDAAIKTIVNCLRFIENLK